MLIGDVRFREDLSSVVDQLLLTSDDMKFLSMVNFLPKIKDIFGKPVQSQKHEWLDDEARAEYVTIATGADGAKWDTTDIIAAMPMVTAECNKLRVGDVLLLDQDEVVIVEAVNTAAQTIDLIARGHGSSTAAVLAHDATHVAKIIGNAQIENADPLSADYTTPTEAFNYTQIFEDVAEVTGTVRRSKAVQGDYLDYTIVKKLKEAIKSLNRAMWEGLKNLDGTNKIGTMGGVREFASTQVSNVSGALTLDKLYAAVIVHVDAGNFPSAIHASPKIIGDIEQLFVGNVRYKTSSTRVGLSVATVSMMGYEIEIHMDRHARATEFLIMDYNRCAYGPLEGGEYESGDFASYPILNKRNGKQIATQVLGEYTMRCSNKGATRAYGST
ncbi:DUF5309 family protein [Candidatus Parcubacteria bacterium]|nr:DUF5309 family protein [Candidatus Parcubacteria bacterium]